VPGSLEREIRDLRAILFSDRDPDGRGFAPLADALRRAGDLGQALDVVEQGVGRLPEFATGHVVAGWVYRARDQGDEAERSFRKVLALDDENISALKGLGLILVERGEGDEALAHFRTLDDLDPGDPEVQARLVELGDLDRLRASSGSGAEPSDPIVAIEELAPDSGKPGLVVDIEDLAPDAPATVDAASPHAGSRVVDIEDLAPAPEAFDAVVDIEDLAPGGYERPGAPEVAPEIASAPDAPPSVARPMTPASDGERNGGEGPEDEGPWTRTMAELYVRQGHPDRAVRIYRRLAEEKPDDASITSRLADLERGSVDVDSVDFPAGPVGVVGVVELESDARDADSGIGAENDANVGPDPTVAGYLTSLLAWRRSPGSEGGDAP